MLYFCDCTKYCKTLKEVSRSTYQRHAQFRELDFTNVHNPRHSPRPAHDFPGTLGPPQRMHQARLVQEAGIGIVSKIFFCIKFVLIEIRTVLRVGIWRILVLVQATMWMMRLWLNHPKYVWYSSHNLWPLAAVTGVTHLNVRIYTNMTMMLHEGLMRLRMNSRITQPDSDLLAASSSLSKTKSSQTQVVWRMD
jgi:hypothetical protein